MLALLLGLATAAPVAFSVKTVQGLNATFAGVPIVRGSWFQYYDPVWKRGHYDSNWNNQKIETLASGETVMRFKSGDGLAFGTQTYTPATNGFTVTFDFFWSGSSETRIEVGAGNLWATPLRQGQLLVDGAPPARTLAATNYAGGSLEERQYGPFAQRFEFQTPFGKLTAQGTGARFVLYDARGMNQPWIDGKDIWWLGAKNVLVRPGQRTRLTMSWTFEPSAGISNASMARDIAPRPVSTVLMPPSPAFRLIPKPKESKIDPSDPMVLGNDLSIDLPNSLKSFQQEFTHFVGLLWNIGKVEATGESNRIFTRIQDSDIPDEGYEIWINPKTAIIRGEDDAGLRHALRTLAQLVFVKNGKLCLPTAHIRDWPSTIWRGVHLFVGPDAPQFQEKLWENVLGPLKFNKALIQCERTRWDSQPVLGGLPGEMSKQDLARLFGMYRTLGVEPIPLIQSFGHMQWFFANNANLDLAAFPETPYRIDPDNPKAREAIARIWEEAVALLKPTTVHFGLDEVDSRSFAEDPAVITKLWTSYVPYLGELAQKLGVKMMLWGDMALARGEAADAAHAGSLDDARVRRNAIPEGSLVGDWHYKNDPNTERFLNSLRLWKDAGHKPVAATWFNSANIANFYKAAVQEGAGTLQTTWVGYDSNEASMLRDFRQFSAMVVAADYAWSGRTDEPRNLGYVASEVFSQMYYGFRSELSPKAGWTLGGSTPKRIGDVGFNLFDPIKLYSVLTPGGGNRAAEVSLNTGGPVRASALAFAMSAGIRCNEDEELGEVVVTLADGREIKAPLCYGRNVRADDDPLAIILGHRNGPLSGWTMKLSEKPVEISKVAVRQSSTYAGLKLFGVSGWE